VETISPHPLGLHQLQGRQEYASNGSAQVGVTEETGVDTVMIPNTQLLHWLRRLFQKQRALCKGSRLVSLVIATFFKLQDRHQEKLM
jgi:hypothetical protein